MKTKISTLVVSVLALALLIAVTMGISVGAEENTEISIIAQNIVYGDRVAVAFAVNADPANASDITVKYYWEDENEVKEAELLDPTVTDNLYQKKDSEGNVIASYPVFVTEGVPAKDLSRVAKAVAYTGDTAPAEFAHDYSVAEYLYSRLYKDGYKDKTEADGKDYERMKLYNLLLEYGAQAQTVLENYGSANPEPLVTESVYAYTETEGVTLNGASFAFAPAGETLSVTPAYTDSETVIAWNLIKADTSVITINNGETASITAAVMVEPVFGQIPELYDFDDGVIPVTNFFKVTSTLKSSKYPMDGSLIAGSEEYDTYIATGAGKNNTKTIINTNGTQFYIVSDPTNAANKVLQSCTRNGSIGASYIEVTASTVSAGDVYEISFDYYIDFNQNTGKDLFILSDGTNNILKITSNAANTTDFNGSAETETAQCPKAEQLVRVVSGDSYVYFDSHTWYKFKIIVADGKAYQYYSANDGESYTLINSFETAFDSNNAKITINCTSHVMRQYYDDISFIITDTPSENLQ